MKQKEKERVCSSISASSSIHKGVHLFLLLHRPLFTTTQASFYYYIVFQHHPAYTKVCTPEHVCADHSQKRKRKKSEKHFSFKKFFSQRIRSKFEKKKENANPDKNTNEVEENIHMYHTDVSYICIIHMYHPALQRPAYAYVYICIIHMYVYAYVYICMIHMCTYTHMCIHMCTYPAYSVRHTQRRTSESMLLIRVGGKKTSK